jgi:hypothetical protein
VREFRTLGSVRGAARKGGPYRNRSVLPVGDVSPPPACQLLREALDWEEIPAIAEPHTVQAVVERADRKTTRSVRPVEVGPRVLTCLRMRRAR